MLVAQDDFSAERIAGAEVRDCLRELFMAACGFVPDLEIRGPEKKRKTRDDLRAEILEHPLVREAEAHLGAAVIDYGQLH